MPQINYQELLIHISQADLFSKLILGLLILSSLISWTIVFSKSIGFRIEKRRNKKFYTKFESYINGEPDQEFIISQSMEKSSLFKLYDKGEIELSFLKKNLGDRLSDYIDKRGLESIERSLISQYEKYTLKLKKGMGILGTLSSISVFVGLLGTVWGILNAFKEMGQGGGIDSIGPGIAEALIATAAGLIVAIPASFFYNRFLKKLETISVNFKAFIRTYLNYVDRNYFK